LSELVDEAGDAGAELGAGAFDVEAELVAEPSLAPAAVPVPVFASPDPDGFALLYRSAYQPPPLKETAGG
jgi:hypothetical protein